MKKIMMTAVLCCLMVMIAASACACGPRILIEDSDTRALTTRELNRYSYDALGYILNEIVARHGYHFDHDGKYYSHFCEIYEYNPVTEMWENFYVEAPDYVTNQMIYEGMTNTEQKNMSLIKKVRKEKKARGEYTGEDTSLWLCNEDGY